MLEILQAETLEGLRGAKELFEEYAGSLEFDLEFQDFAAEVAGLPGAYAPPNGRLLLAFHDGGSRAAWRCGSWRKGSAR